MYGVLSLESAEYSAGVGEMGNGKGASVYQIAIFAQGGVGGGDYETSRRSNRTRKCADGFYG